MPQADGQWKSRPALLLCPMRPFGDLLLCGISTQLRHKVPDFDEEISPADDDFATANLVAPSLIRLGFLTTKPRLARNAPQLS
jgi:mRNA interferase MazF